eukprot:6412557-Alexandrium_andersonii.AAC.1
MPPILEVRHSTHLLRVRSSVIWQSDRAPNPAAICNPCVIRNPLARGGRPETRAKLHLTRPRPG